MRLDDVFSTLSHIPQERVDRIIKTDSRFLRNSKGEYFHTDIFEITDDELENIAEIIEGFISEDEYAIWTNVWNMIQDKFPLFVENNLYLSGLELEMQSNNDLAEGFVLKVLLSACQKTVFL